MLVAFEGPGALEALNRYAAETKCSTVVFPPFAQDTATPWTSYLLFTARVMAMREDVQSLLEEGHVVACAGMADGLDTPLARQWRDTIRWSSFEPSKTFTTRTICM